MKQRTLVITATLVAALCIPAALLFNASQLRADPPRPAPTETPPAAADAAPKAATAAPEVSVMRVQAASYRARVEGYGEARPRYELQLSSDVSGQVIELSDAFDSGHQVAAGTLLARLDPTDYQQAVASARAELAQAQLDLLEEQRQGEQAREEWHQAGLEGEPASALVLREPQLRAAEATLEEARSQLAAAERDLANTEIRAPFDALVISRDIQPGSVLQAGEAIGTLYSSAQVEVLVSLSSQQWQGLPDPTGLADAPWPVQLSSHDGRQQWTARVQRVTRHITSDTRQRALVAVVDNPLELDAPLYPGTFTRARIEGRQLSGLWQVPASAITQNGSLWLVNDDQQLQEIDADTVFSDAGYSYLRPPAGITAARIALRPLNTYLAGLRVAPIETPRS